MNGARRKLNRKQPPVGSMKRSMQPKLPMLPMRSLKSNRKAKLPLLASNSGNGSSSKKLKSGCKITLNSWKISMRRWGSSIDI